jgi:hypothetical protein
MGEPCAGAAGILVAPRRVEYEVRSQRRRSQPDAVMACAVDIPTKEALAAVCCCVSTSPIFKIRFVNVVALYGLDHSQDHPRRLSDRDFDRFVSSPFLRFMLPMSCSGSVLGLRVQCHASPRSIAGSAASR